MRKSNKMASLAAVMLSLVATVGIIPAEAAGDVTLMESAKAVLMGDQNTESCEIIKGKVEELTDVILIDNGQAVGSLGEDDLLEQKVCIELSKEDLELPEEAQITLMQLKVEWWAAREICDLSACADISERARDVRSDYTGIFYAKDGTTYTFDDVVRVAGLINHEAAMNDYDRFGVGSTFVNRWHAVLRGDSTARNWGKGTTAGVLAAPGQYYNENTDSKHRLWVKNVAKNGWNRYNNRFMYIADLCLSGEYTTPQNVYGQAGFSQGTLFMKVNNNQICGTKGYYTHYYCVMPSRVAIATTDWAGDTALSSQDAWKRIEELSLNAPTL